MQWAFRSLALANALLLMLALFYQSPGEDAAGAGMRLGFAVFYAIALAVLLAVYHFCKARWVRVVVLVLLTLPFLSILYGILLSI